MPTILKEHANCRLYVKGNAPFPRYFISEKTDKLRRLRITKESAATLKHAPDSEFIQVIAIILGNAKANGRADYFEVTI
jgi:hypothetical protein